MTALALEETVSRTDPGLLTDTHPNLAAEWHPTRNVGLNLDSMRTYSNKKVWWLHVDWRGDIHEWQQVVRNRSYEGTGCSHCRHRKGPRFRFQTPKPGASLAERNADLTAEWHPTRNADLTAFDVTLFADRHVWWQCPEGHEWVDKVRVRMSKRHYGCPNCHRPHETIDCSRTRPAKAPRFSDADLVARIAAEWHPTRNGEMTFDRATWSDAPKVWWRCTEGHQWKITFGSRYSSKAGCSKCATKTSGARFQAWKKGDSPTLAAKFPHLAAEWHPTGNGELTPEDVTYGTATIVWWKCETGHEWEASVASRTGRNRGCWCCTKSTQVPKPEDVTDPSRSLAGARPDLAVEWHPVRNGFATPETMNVGSSQKVWWKCSDGHTWGTALSSRSRSGTDCRRCANRIDRERRLTNDLLVASTEQAEASCQNPECATSPDLIEIVTVRLHGIPVTICIECAVDLATAKAS